MKDNLVLTDAFLTDAAGRFDEAWLASLPTPESHEYPADFYKELGAVSGKREKRRTIARRAAVIFIAVLIGGALLFAASPGVRAAVKGWFRETFRTTALYLFTEDAEITELPDYELSYIPEGFEEADRFEEGNIKNLLYVNPDTGDGFSFECHIRSEGMHIQISYDEHLYYEQVSVNGLSGDYYAADETSQTNTLVWFDKTGQIVFVINSNLVKSVMLHIAEGLVLEDSTK